MNNPPARSIPMPGFFNAFVFEDRIEVLVRSADWYRTPPIQRYLYNLAAVGIRMEDAKTETRVYTFDRYESLRQLVHLSFSDEFKAAIQAWSRWATNETTFGVVHLNQEDGKRGDLIVGDDPNDVGEFAPDEEGLAGLLNVAASTWATNGSDA